MKKIIKRIAAAALVAALVAAASAAIAPHKNITLAWDYPEAEVGPDLFFKLYHSTNLFTPAEAWECVGMVSGTNRTIQIIIEPAAHFYFVTASNWWGESGPSNIASTPAVPRDGIQLNMKLK